MVYSVPLPEEKVQVTELNETLFCQNFFLHSFLSVTIHRNLLLNVFRQSIQLIKVINELNIIFTGEYEVSVKFNDEHIPGSTFPVHVTGVGRANKDTVSETRDSNLIYSFVSFL